VNRVRNTLIGIAATLGLLAGLLGFDINPASATQTFTSMNQGGCTATAYTYDQGHTSGTKVQFAINKGSCNGIYFRGYKYGGGTLSTTQWNSGTKWRTSTSTDQWVSFYARTYSPSGDRCYNLTDTGVIVSSWAC
jgi:hypothetical protein